MEDHHSCNGGHGSKEKAAWARSGAVALRATIGASADLVWPATACSLLLFLLPLARWVMEVSAAGRCSHRPPVQAPAGREGRDLQHGPEPAQDQQVEGVEHIKEPLGKTAAGSYVSGGNESDNS